MNITVFNLVLVALLYFPICALIYFRKGLKAARQSGIPYLVLPVYLYDQRWLLMSNMVLPLLRKIIPLRWQGLWLDLMHPEWAWNRQYLPFQDSPKGMGVDTFLVVSPFKTT